MVGLFYQKYLLEMKGMFTCSLHMDNENLKTISSYKA